jgi:hypothetical protein
MKDKYVPPEEHTVEHMNRLNRSDGIGVLARCTGVAAIAIVSSVLPLQSPANEQTRGDQVTGRADRKRFGSTHNRSA